MTLTVVPGTLQWRAWESAQGIKNLSCYSSSKEGNFAPQCPAPGRGTMGKSGESRRSCVRCLDAVVSFSLSTMKYDCIINEFLSCLCLNFPIFTFTSHVKLTWFYPFLQTTKMERIIFQVNNVDA